MTDHQLRRSFVVELELTGDDEEPFHEPPPGSVASIATHDLPSLAAWWTDAEVDDRERLARWAGVSPDADDPVTTLYPRLVEHLASTDAGLVLLDVADLRGDATQVNAPGRGDHPNWRLRATQPIEVLMADAGVAAVLDRVVAAREAPLARDGHDEREG
jgi:4-alpha-glucanotransferase